MATRTKSVMMPSEKYGSRRPRVSRAGRAWTSGKGTASGVTGSAGMADPRVDHRVEAVDGEVHHGHDDRGGEHHRLDHGIVARADPLVGQAAEARPGEHRLHHDRGGHEDGEVNAR